VPAQPAGIFKAPITLTVIALRNIPLRSLERLSDPLATIHLSILHRF
jgi:hypothetical protein